MPSSSAKPGPAEVYVSKSLDGPWEHLGTITVEGEPRWHGSNVSIMARPDGNFEFTQRDGRIMFSDKGILGPYKAQGASVFPGHSQPRRPLHLVFRRPVSHPGQFLVHAQGLSPHLRRWHP